MRMSNSVLALWPLTGSVAVMVMCSVPACSLALYMSVFLKICASPHLLRVAVAVKV
ncbi:MAG: hypothetical protein ISP86_02245 [Shewanellaceae bacterium]|nr:hypothetical protein [Shewanellaceae bacterium]